MPNFKQARRALLRELKPAEEAVRTIRRDRGLLARLHQKLKRDEARRLQTVSQINQALAALQPPRGSTIAAPSKQSGEWSKLVTGSPDRSTDKEQTAAKRLAKKIVRRHQPEERRTLLRLVGLLRGGLERLSSGRDPRMVGKVTTSFDPNSRRDVLRMLELAGVEVEQGRLRQKGVGADVASGVDRASGR